MAEGDIIVTEMTMPDMVPAMKRAAGIVTDEGGMTSHAAIVSRELGVPAVVGAEDATQKLRDGETSRSTATREPSARAKSRSEEDKDASPSRHTRRSSR